MNDKASLIFSVSDIQLVIPEYKDKDTLPDHVVDATCVLLLLTEFRNKIQPLLDEMRTLITES